ncbi:RHS repeat-associated core domain-containing protein [Pseudomonas sp. NPDC008258]|uniref:RHS repeat-associated core domain-containing protein n=1 Tax=Pseudomonas sp. NPDC008258 TaxID=3364418 RepID=UPI0036E88030
MKIHAPTYTPYGYIHSQARPDAMLGFNGERYDPFTDSYLLGQGYRSYNPTLMRFYKPDDHSPFGQGGYNAYAYCNSDPLNYRDDTGHTRTFAQLKAYWGAKSQPTQPTPPPLKPVPKKKVTFSNQIDRVVYTSEHDAIKSRLIEQKQSLELYTQRFSKRVERKLQDFELLMEPSTSEFAKSRGFSDKRYQKEVEKLATWLDEAHERLEQLNATLRSFHD